MLFSPRALFFNVVAWTDDRENIFLGDSATPYVQVAK
jgi:hypothetical protein